MADIELVIEIPDEIYNGLFNNEEISGGECAWLLSAIKNGTPLPKGHGRIADIDKVSEEMRATRTYDIPFALDRVKPIIEADKAESEVRE